MTTYTKTMSEALNEVYLGEDNMALMKKAAGGAMQTLKMKDGKVKMDSFTASAIMGVYKAINPKNKKTLENVINTGTKSALMKLQSLAMKSIKSGYHEEVELDEKIQKIQDIPDKKLKFYKSVPHPSYTRKEIENEILRRKKTGDSVKEEVDLDEGKMKELHMLIKQGKSAEEIAKIMKLDKKTIQALMAGYSEEVDLDEASARADAKRAMRKDKEIDPADVDSSATDDDVKAASKNIMMQINKFKQTSFIPRTNFITS